MNQVRIRFINQNVFCGGVVMELLGDEPSARNTSPSALELNHWFLPHTSVAMHIPRWTLGTQRSRRDQKRLLGRLGTRCVRSSMEPSTSVSCTSRYKPWA